MKFGIWELTDDGKQIIGDVGECRHLVIDTEKLGTAEGRRAAMATVMGAGDFAGLSGHYARDFQSVVEHVTHSLNAQFSELRVDYPHAGVALAERNEPSDYST